MGCHPRHPPRAFSLGLLAPRCLCALLFRATPPYSAVARNSSASIWGEEGILPPASVSSSQLLAFATAISDGSGGVNFMHRIDGPSESALAQPPSAFPFLSLLCRFRYAF